MDNHLHIVCHDVPYPVDYGGVVNQFHTIRLLHDAGVKVHLHCFDYGRGQQSVLAEYCAEVNYYDRHEGHKGFSHKLPYIVCSRSNPHLLDNLLRDSYPILLEGIHCTYLLNDPRFHDRKIVLRLHNVEYLYYRQLYHTERSLFKKMYYLHESNLLRHYEQQIAGKVKILALSFKDSEQYQREFGADRIDTLPAFLPFDTVRSREGTGCFCLYHGNLSVAENEQAAVWLLKKVFASLDLPLIVSGKNPSARLTKLIEQNPHACLIADPSEEELQDLIAKAQVHILPSFNCTGVKLKLLNALYNGRHCVVNRDAVEGTGLEPVCHVADDAEDMQSLVTDLYTRPVSAQALHDRSALLSGLYNQENNLHQLMQSLW